MVNAKPILISFDGSGYIDMWRKTIQLAKDNNIKFTYFISAPYYATESWEKDHPYWALTEDKRPLLIKFRNDNQANNIDLRFQLTQEAQLAGCEIGSHLVGHYDGRSWTYEQWMKEFAYFKQIICNDQTNSNHFINNIVGVRAPFMCVNPAYYKALKDSGFKWDSSSTVVHSKILRESGLNIPIIPVEHMEVFTVSQNEDTGKKESTFDCDWVADIQWKLFPRTMLETQTAERWDQNAAYTMGNMYFNALCFSYENDSQPLQICLHFQHRPGEPYYNAMVRFINWVKDKNPTYLTYSEYYYRVYK